jgi:release factor glutamine methyltransferase
MTSGVRLIQSVLREAQQQLAHTLGLDKPVARLEARMLLQHLLSVEHAWLLAHETEALDTPQLDQFRQLLQRRLLGEPIAHILGHREFYGLQVKVSADTLIPRPDTEVLVETALTSTPISSPCKVLDLGTGSGAIALAMASKRPSATIIAVDRSNSALDVARENARRLGINNISFLQSDWFSELAGQQFDVIVSNPPYIPDGDPHLQQGDLRFEPQSALASGRDGLNDIRKIVNLATMHLTKQGSLHLEHGHDQPTQVSALMQSAGFVTVKQHRDLAGILRVTSGYLSEG